MIEIRIPTPSEDKLKLLEKYEPSNWGNFVYVCVLKKNLKLLKKFIVDNDIAKSDKIEEIRSGNWPTLGKTSLMIEYLEKNNIDFTVGVYAKLSNKEIEDFMDWQEENNIIEE